MPKSIDTGGSSKGNKKSSPLNSIFFTNNDPDSAPGNACETTGCDDRVPVELKTTEGSQGVGKHDTLTAGFGVKSPLFVDDNNCLKIRDLPWPAARNYKGEIVPAEGVDYDASGFGSLQDHLGKTPVINEQGSLWPVLNNYKGEDVPFEEYPKDDKIGYFQDRPDSHPYYNERCIQWPIDTRRDPAREIECLPREQETGCFQDRTGPPLIYKPCSVQGCESLHHPFQGVLPLTSAVTNKMVIEFCNEDCYCDMNGLISISFAFTLVALYGGEGVVDYKYPVRFVGRGGCVGQEGYIWDIGQDEYEPFIAPPNYTHSGGGQIAFAVQPGQCKTVEIWGEILQGAGGTAVPSQLIASMDVQACYMTTTNCCNDYVPNCDPVPIKAVPIQS